jgi:hypothetical protein
MELTRVPALDGARQFALAGGMACARVPEGLRCVRRDPSLEDGDPEVWTIDVQTEANLVSGGQTVCAIDEESRLSCWGQESFIPFESPGRAVLQGGQLGEWSRVPVVVAEQVSSAAVGMHHCLVDETGGVRCAGSNSLGQAGGGSGAEFTDIGLAMPASLVAVGINASCATTRSALWCWGNRSVPTGCGALECAYEMAGPEYMARCQRPQPELVAEMDGTRVASLQMDSTRVCALSDGGELRCAPLSPVWWDGLTAVADDVRSFALDTEALCDGSAWCEGALAKEVRDRRHEALPGRFVLVVPGDN